MGRLRIEGVSKEFRATPKSVVALKGLNLETTEQELLVLLGPSGCGKTTTLRLIAGLETPTAGTIYLGDARFDTLPPERRNVSMVFQQPALYPQMSAGENISLPLKLRKSPPSEIATKTAEVSALLGVTDLLSRSPFDLSGGQQQRVALARALITSPDLFLLDEPLSSVDPASRLELRKEIRDIQRRTGVTMIYVTHDQEEAMALGDRIALMNRGEIEQIGTPHDLYFNPINLFTATFLGSPPMNLVTGTVSRLEGKVVCEFLGTSTSIEKNFGEINDSREVLLGIRPEEIDFAVGEIPARVVEIVPAFPDQHLYVEAAGAVVCLRVPGNGRFLVGQHLFISFARARLFGFDPDTGNRLF